LKAPTSSIRGNHRNKTATVFREKYQSVHQSNLRSVQAKIVNINATNNMFLAFTMMQQIITEPLGTVTEKEKIALITSA
jgi:hypothetical protein